jgi:uncharacterized repeat protein (TIGR03803 family)
MSSIKSTWWKTIGAALVLWAFPHAGLAQSFHTVVSFNGPNGQNPIPAVVQGLDGNFYGTTEFGGLSGCGTVFEVTAKGTVNTLFTFEGASGTNPFGALVLGTDGNFYGTTGSNGAFGNGTVFKMKPSGALTTLHNFGTTDGSFPTGALVQGTDGSFYGTTDSGGANGVGTVFKITSAGMLTTLHSFDVTDGANPFAGLIQATDGNFYGTTYNGGANGVGTVFKITPAGVLTTLHSFNTTDGSFPDGALVQGADGAYYGTTSLGGANSCLIGGTDYGCGTVFKITAAGTLTTLHSFDGTDGQSPGGALAQATDGNFYGTTAYGGGSSACTYGCGTIFEITSAGTLTTLHSFDFTDGAYPSAAPLQATNGTFYGTTEAGGSSGAGVIFSLSVGLGPFVRTLPLGGKVGAAVKILGTNLTSATGVTFNGAPATFTVVSSSEITTTVPVGATTGTVQVTTPRGTLSSNVAFRVR